ncbi:Plakophilin-1 [Varanus komodoensis]|uniref:plakophilin-1 n=1 Tax=Varanus komodoensis TaxID=61221 RepID=UPI001CF78E28|nr:plakophilin-1 [Varanus komodoensis]KAF7253737.1 Plakophilin-1 [Varanus komodoensis]
MLHSPSPLKTALAYECFQDQANSTLALPSDHKLKMRGTGKQRVQEQVMMTVKRQKQKSSLSSGSNVAGLSNRGSMYDGLADGYNYGTARGSYYAKAHTGNNWGHAMYNGTLKREAAESKRYSSYSQMDGWGSRNYNKICSPTSPGSDYCFLQHMKSSRSEPDLCYDPPRGTLRRNQSGSRVGNKASLNRHSLYSSTCNQHGITTMTRTNKRVPFRSSSCTSANKQDVLYAQPVASKQDMVYGQARSSSKICNDEIDYGAMTIQKAIQLLCSSDEKYQAMGAYYLQHTCFQDESAKQEVYRLGGIAKLIELLRSPDENVQQASAGALRNLVFRNPTNKIETRRQNGIRESVSLLRRTGNTEIQKQLTGLLWNLSSTDELKEDLINDALPVLTDRVIIPFSGWSDGVSNRSREMVDPEVFFNATGCLRNLSSADAGRQTMRNYPGLIDAVMAYSQNCVAANRPDDKSVENCICILHNLSYRLDAEVPNKYTQLNHMARSTYTDKSLTGCFNNRGGKLEYEEYDLPLPEEDLKPRGSSWLYHSDAIRTYLSLMNQSKKDATLEACAGALQNLTASRGLMSNAMSQMIALKEKGLPRIARLLQSSNAEVVRSGTSLLSNMSRHPIVHKTMAHQVLPDVTRLLALQAPGSSNYGDIMTSACYTLRNLLMSNPQMAKPYLTGSLLNNVVSLCRNGSYPKAAEAARMLLSDLWSNREFHTILKQQGYDKNMMGSLTGSSFRTLSSRF